MIKALIDLPEPPPTLATFMSHQQQQERLDARLGTALATTLDDICPYLLKGKGLLHAQTPESHTSVDSQDNVKESARSVAAAG
jgi:hypothetical protein